jgi:uncharacterized protein (UPF0216 family)
MFTDGPNFTSLPMVTVLQSRMTGDVHVESVHQVTGKGMGGQHWLQMAENSLLRVRRALGLRTQLAFMYTRSPSLML